MDTGPTAFHFNEKHLSQIPALQLLVNLGYRYLTPTQALARLGTMRCNPYILDKVLTTP